VLPRFGQAIVPAAATNIVAIAAGDYHSIAMRADGTVLAWGAGQMLPRRRTLARPSFRRD
jgi:alpha-tubulin suppressor-like RCC1 family protein